MADPCKFSFITMFLSGVQLNEGGERKEGEGGRMEMGEKSKGGTFNLR